MKNQKQNPEFVLYGITGTYNYGCEAIVRGTEQILRKKWPNAVIKYASPIPNEDKKNLEGSGVIVIERKTIRTNILSKIIWRLQVVFGIFTRHIKVLEDMSFLKTCDVVLSIGGDIYNLPPHHKKNQIKGYYNWRIGFGKYIKERNKKIIIWGSSIGPFDENMSAKRAYIKHFKKDVYLITSREDETYNYLINNNVTNVVKCGDPAFMLKGPQKTSFSNGNLKIGINLSPLSIMHIDTTTSTEALIREQASCIEEIINKYNAEIILIPHVISKAEFDDDFSYLNKIKGYIKNQYQDKITIAQKGLGFLGTKNILVECDIIIAARMHCAINAMSCCVPTLLLSYSSKAKGMARFVYGNENYVLPLNLFGENEFFNAIYDMLAKKEEINLYLTKRIDEIKNEAVSVIDKIEIYE